MEITINGKILNLRKAKFDLSKFDSDGRCDDYTGREYVAIDRIYGKDNRRTDELDLDEVVIGKFKRIFDENNRRSAFDPLNYSEYIQVVLDVCNENYIDEIYEIV
jgi:hypothetical protein